MASFYAPVKLSDNMKETPEGFLLCLNVPIARTGTMEYGPKETPLDVGKNGKVLIYRDAAEVFKPETIASFEGKPVTIEHPSDFVDPKNWKTLAKGIVQNVREGDKDEDGEQQLIADILVTDAEAIRLIKDGLREVSCGYEAEYDQTGDGKGKQTNIIGNHLALVKKGRAGESYSITDSYNSDKGTKKIMSNKLKDALTKVFGEKERVLVSKAVDESMAEESKDDELVKSVKDLMSGNKDLMDKVADLLEKAGPKEEAHDEEEAKAKDDGEEKAEDEEEMKAKDDDKSENETEANILERVKNLEAAMAKMLKSMSDDDDEEEAMDEDGEEMEAAQDSEEEEKSEDDDEEEEPAKKKAADSASKPLAGTKPAATADSRSKASDSAIGNSTDRINQLNAAFYANRKGYN